MPTVAFAAHILPGREEGWRRFMQEISEVRPREYEGCRRRLGVRNESVWLARTGEGETALAYLETDKPDLLISRLASSDEPFDVWLKGRLVEFHGRGLARLPRRAAAELIFSYEDLPEGDLPVGRSEQAMRDTYDAYGLSTDAAEWVFGSDDPRPDAPQ